MGESISREEHNEFARRMEAENKRIEDENARQNYRIENLEDTVLELTSRQIAALTAAIERLTVNVGTIVDEQKKFGARLSALEDQDGKKWRAAVIKAIEVVIAAGVGYLLAHLAA